MTERLRLSDRLGLAATVLMVIAALAGLVIPGLYRDRAILIDATRADNLFQLVVALPLLAGSLWLAHRGSA